MQRMNQVARPLAGFILWILLPGAVLADRPLVTRTALGGNLTVLVPENLKKSTDEPDTEAFVDELPGEMLVVAFERQLAIRPQDLPTLLEATRIMYMSYARQEFAGLRILHGETFAVVRGELDNPDDKRHLLIARTAYQGGVLSVTYMCSKRTGLDCRERAGRILESISLTRSSAAS